MAEGADRAQVHRDEINRSTLDRPLLPDATGAAEAKDASDLSIEGSGPGLAAPIVPLGEAPVAHGATQLQRQAALLRLQQTRGNQFVARMLAQRDVEPPPSGVPNSSPGASAPASIVHPAGSSQELIVDDGAQDVHAGQMTKSTFLAHVRTAVDTTVEQNLAGSSWAAMVRPKIDEQIDQQFALYATQTGSELERSIRDHVPAVASAATAEDLITPISEQVRQAVAAQLPQSDGATGGVGSVAGILFQAREGGAHDVEDPKALQSQLTAGHGLDSGVRTGMESAFGQSFSDVRVHSDATAGQLSQDLNARAFTVGHDIAFGAGEYRPGTMVGDALIAHELAHVVQQGPSTASAPLTKGDTDYGSLETDADASAVGAVASLWNGAKDLLGAISQQALPQLKAGLRLQRCSGHKDPVPAPTQTSTPVPTPTPTQAPAPTSAPTPNPSSTPTPVAPGAIRRIPLHGIGLGFQGDDLDSVATVQEIEDKETHVTRTVNHLVREFTSESAAKKAVAYVPDGVKTLTSPRTVDVLVHLHGFNIGYRAPKGGAKARDERLDMIGPQLTASGRLMIAILPQGGFKSDFGAFNADAYVAEVFKLLVSQGNVPSGIAPGRVVLSGHSGGGGQLSRMFQNDLNKQTGKSPASALTLPATMGEIVLLDAINDSSADPDGGGQLGIARKWIESQLNRDLANLQAKKADAVANGKDPTTAQLDYLKNSLRFRGYYTHTAGDYYAKSYKKLDEKITKWFADHAGDLGGASSSVLDALRKNYIITDTGHADHDAILGKSSSALGGKAPLEDALGALP